MELTPGPTAGADGPAINLILLPTSSHGTHCMWMFVQHCRGYAFQGFNAAQAAKLVNNQKESRRREKLLLNIVRLENCLQVPPLIFATCRKQVKLVHIYYFLYFEALYKVNVTQNHAGKKMVSSGDIWEYFKSQFSGIVRKAKLWWCGDLVLLSQLAACV